MATATQPRQSAPAVQQAALEKVFEYIPFQAREPIKLTIYMVRDNLCKPTKKGQLASDADILKFIMLCKSRQLNPWEGDAFLVGYDGQNGPEFSLITAHQAFLKRAEVHPEYDGMDSGTMVQDRDGIIVDREGDFFFEDDKLLGGWAVVYFKSRRHPMRKRLRLQSRYKDNRFWKDDPAGQIVKCAEADALRSSFPTSMGGLYLDQEIVPRVEEAPPSLPSNGRSSFRRGLLPSPTFAPPANFEAPRQEDYVFNGESHDPEQAAQTAPDQQGLDDLLSDLREGIAKASTYDEMEAIGATMKHNETWMGKDNYDAVLKVFQERNAVLKKAKK